MTEVNVIALDGLDEEDEGFAEFIETLKTGNESAVFLISKEDGSISVGSTAKSAKDLLWDVQNLKRLMERIIDGDIA